MLNYLSILILSLGVVLIGCGIKGLPRPPLTEDMQTQNNKPGGPMNIIEPTKALISEPTSKDNTTIKRK